MLLLIGGCGEHRDARCRFGAEHSVFSSSASALDDLALAASGGGGGAVISDVSGLTVRRLNTQGQPTAAGVRIAERCQGGLAAVQHGAALYVACLRPAAVSAVTLYVLDAAQRVTRSVAFGRAGSRSQGISLVVTGGRVLIGFQDAVVGEARAWLAELQVEDAAQAREPSLRVISDVAWFAGAPSLALRDQRAFAVWSELANAGDAALGRLMLGEVGRTRAPHVLAQTQSASPSPALIGLPDKWVVVYRDLRDVTRRVGLYMVGLGEDGQALGEALRLARADGEGQPVLRACAGSLVAAAPRTFGGDEFVGVVGVDLGLHDVSGEQQFYEDSRAFWQVAAACAGSSALLLVGERGRPERSGASVYAVPFICR